MQLKLQNKGFFFPFFQVHLIKKEVLSILADTLWQPICVCAQMKYFLHNIKANILWLIYGECAKQV